MEEFETTVLPKQTEVISRFEQDKAAARRQEVPLPPFGIDMSLLVSDTFAQSTRREYLMREVAI